jgi:hypothetical protein
MLFFPGGGVHFYWQTGAAQYLREHFNLENICMAGSSAGTHIISLI